MQNFDAVLANSNTSLQANGSAMKENEAFMSSLQGKTNKLVSEFEKFSNAVLDSGLVGGILDLGTGMLQLENNTGLVIPALTLLGITTIPSVTSAVTTLGVALGVSTGGLTWILAGIVALITAVPKLVDAVTTTVDEQKTKVDDLVSSLGDLNAQYKALSDKENKTDLEEQKLAILEQQIKIREKEIDQNKTLLAQKEMLGKGEFGGGLAEQSSFDARKLEDYANSYQNLTQAMEDYGDKTSKEYDMMAERLSEHETMITQLSATLIDENLKMTESLEFLNGKEKEQVQARIDANNETLKSFPIVQDLINSQRSMAESTNDVTEAMGGQEDKAKSLQQEMQALTKISRDAIDANDELDKSVIKLKSGQELSRKEIDNLLDTYPQLLDQLHKTDQGYQLNVESLEKLKDANIQTARTAIDAEVKKTEQTIASVKNRISAHSEEIQSVGNLAQAYALLAKAASTSASSAASAALGSYASTGTVDTGAVSSALNANKQFNRDAEQLVGAYQKIEALKKESLKLDVSIANSSRDVGEAVSKNLSKGASKAKSAQDKLNKEIEKTLERYNQIKDKISDIGKEIRALKATSAELTSNLKQLQAGDFSLFETDKTFSLEELKPLIEKQKTVIKKLNDDLYTLSTKNNKKLTENQKKELDKQLDAVKERIKKEEDIQKDYAKNLEKIRSDMEKDYEKRVKKEVDTRIKALKDANDEEIKLNKQKQDRIKSQQDALEELQKLTIDMIKQEKDEEVKAIQDQIDAIDKLSNARKNALKEEQESRDYSKTLKNKEKAIGDIEKRIAELQFDTSSKGIKERLELESQLAEQKEELEDIQYDKSIEKQEKAIDEETQRQKDKLDSQINKIKDYLSKEGQIRDDANSLIENHSKQLYDKLTNYNKDYVGMSEKELENLYSTAISGLEEWGGSIDSVTSAFDRMADTIDDLAKELEKLQDFEISDDIRDSIQEEVEREELPDSMKDEEGNRRPNVSEKDAKIAMQKNQQKYLHNLATEAKRTNNKAQISWIEAERRRWGIDEKSGAISQEGKVPDDYYQSNKNKYGIYHNGGFVGGVKSNETFAKLLDGEFVSNKAQMNNLIDKTIPKLTQESVERFSSNSNIGNFMNITVNGDLTKDTIPELERLKNNGVKQLTEGLKNRGLRVNAKSYGI